jgi:homoserine dehydrogenase
MALRILMLGAGTVGRGLLKAISQRKEFSVCGIASSSGSIYSKDGLPKDALGGIAGGKKPSEIPGFSQKSALELVREAEYDVLVELTTTNLKDAEPAYSHMRAALSRGKHLVTSNKGPLALHFHELESEAERNGCIFRFEATVGGAIPIFATANSYLKGDRVHSVKGILNGTTNYILTRMYEEKLPYAAVLKEAQQLGIAERDPGYDVEGIDAAAKLAIVAGAIFRRKASFGDVRRAGISRITPELLELAASQNCRVKLICSADAEGNMEVAPRFVPLSDPLASINGTLNAITLQAEMAGPLTLVGKGAGEAETASAVLADLMEIAEKVGK